MSGKDAVTLEAVIKTLQSGVEFYETAAVNSSRTQHQRIFERMALTRTAAINYLKPFLQTREEGIHAFGSVLQKMYPEMLAGLDPEDDRLWVEKSAEMEKETHSAMCKALRQIQSETVKSVLIDVYPQINCRLDKAS